MTLPLEFEILICAPNGCADARTLLNGLSGVDLSNKKITILEFEPNCTKIENSLIPKEKVEHRLFKVFGDFYMRRQGFTVSVAKWLIFLEDHSIPDRNFFFELQSYVDQASHSKAITFYSKNGTSNSVGSRAIYNWVWGESEVSIFPKKPAPVCSAFLVERESAVLEIEKRGRNLQKGELEMQIIPELVQQDSYSETRKITIVHFEDINLIQAMRAIVNNGRISGHLEKYLLTPRGWFPQMLRRYFLRSSRIRRINKFGFVDSVSLELLAICGFVGVLVGRYFGIGKAEIELANAHPVVRLGQ